MAASKPSTSLLALAAVLLACAPDLRQDFPFDGALPEGNYVVNTDLGSGLTQTEVNASFQNSWVYLDLDTKNEVPVADALGKPDWDLGFQRYRIVSNSGVSGVGNVEVAILPDQDFDALTQAPASGYLKDAADGSDSNQDVDSAFLIGDGWYLYTFNVHGLTPRPIVYVVHASSGAYFKMQMLGYYDQAGSSAHPSFKWGPVAAP